MLEQIPQGISIATSIFSLFGMASFVAVVVSAIFGLLRPMYRFGLAIRFKKVYIVAEHETELTIRNDLIASGIIHEKNIISQNKNGFDDCKNARLLILEYKHLGEEKISEFLKARQQSCGVLIYAEPNTIDENTLKDINESQHVSIVNFRGRLVNEAAILLISTAFTRKDIKNQ